VSATFILRRSDGNGPSVEEATVRAEDWPAIRTLDRSQQTMLVTGSEADIKDFAACLHGWILVPFRRMPLPDPRPRVAHPPRRARTA
jgi:hypothetical protein